RNEITVFFIARGFRFLFHSKVLKRDTFKLHGESETPVLIIRMPEDIYDGERRDFFRVPAPMDPPVDLKFRSYFETGQSFDQQQEMPDMEEYGMSEAFIFDISGGGLGMKSKEEISLMVGDIVNLRFRLRPGDPNDIQVEGLINNSRRTPDKTAFIKGVEFIPDRNDNYRNALKKISRYVMERQREMINPYN
ncbi:MAG: hypothetical protein GY950_27930, partial [bacterium]|nr:hypothetical protein [bacterium]